MTDRVLTLNETRAYLAGVLAGDAWLSESVLGLRVADEDFARFFAMMVADAFGIDKPPKRDERGYWLYRTSNRGRFDSLRDVNPRGVGTTAAWLRGLFDSEGNAQLAKLKKGQNSYTRRVAFYSTNLDTINRTIKYLDRLDLPTRLSTRKATKGHLGTKPVYEVRLRDSKSNYERFATIVGSSIGRKQLRLDAIFESYSPPGFHARAQAAGALVRNARKAAGGKY